MDPMEYIVPDRKRLPYGMMNFAAIRRDNYYYVDKTHFIPMIEQADRYADTDTVKRAIGGMQLHKVVVIYKGMEMRVCEEV